MNLTKLATGCWICRRISEHTNFRWVFTPFGITL